MLVLLALAYAVEPHLSLDTVVSANGYGVVRLTGGVPDLFSDHLYQSPGPGLPDTWDLLYDTYFGFQAAGRAEWLNSTAVPEVEPGTNIISVSRSSGDLRFTEYVVSPIELESPAFLQVFRVEYVGAAPLDSLSIFSLHNYHLGSDDGAGNRLRQEQLAFEAGALYEVGVETGLGVRVMPLPDPRSLSAPRVGCDTIYAGMLDGEPFDGACEVEGDDRVGGFQFELGPMDPGEVRWLGTLTSFYAGADPAGAAALADTWVGDRGPEELLTSIRTEWSAWLSKAVVPEAMRVEEASLYAQSLVWLRSAQVREAGASFGQIVASLPAAEGEFLHLWNIAWVRDGAYAAAALARAGFAEEAAAALAFMVQEGMTGAYEAEVGAPYRVSVCRYYGDGTEWSDSDHTGPNIELDGFGLWLWAFEHTINASDPAEADRLLLELGPVGLDGIADVLVQAIDDTGLIQADSSIWEEHWNGNEKHFAYTSAWAVAGLRAAARLAERSADGRAEGYRQAADDIAGALAVQLLRDGVLLANLEEDPRSALDAASIEAFNLGVLGAPGPELDATLDALAALKVGSGRGYRRNDDGDAYDEQEWIMVDLRMAEAHRRACRTAEAVALEDWTTDQGAMNNWTLPELLDPESGDYNGPAPMIGFGAGLYAWQLLVRDEADADCLAGSDPAPDDTGSAGADDSGRTADDDSDTVPRDSRPIADSKTIGSDGCGCGSEGRAAWWGLGGLLLAVRRRGRLRQPGNTG